MLSRRIAEYRAGVGQLERLRGETHREQLLDALPRDHLVHATEAEPGGNDPLVFAELRMAQRGVPVADLEFARATLGELSGARHREDPGDDVPGLGSVAARIHRKRPAHRAG